MNGYGQLLTSVGKNITRLRKKKGLTHSQLTYACDVEKANLVRIEKGKVNATLKTLWRIASALEVNVSDLLAAEE